MQYLLKVTLKGTSAWRLLAIDGSSDLAQVGALIAVSFDYPSSNCEFVINNQTISAGNGGHADAPEQLRAFDELKLCAGDEFAYNWHGIIPWVHDISVMKAEEKLFCVIPSCLVGSGLLPEYTEKLLLEDVINYLDSTENPGLDLRPVTQRMRALGGRREDISSAMINAGAAPLPFSLTSNSKEV